MEKLTFIQYLSETENPLSQAKLRQHRGKINWRSEADQEMDPANDKNAELQTSASAPYMVGWSGQSHEWYGDDDMQNGRYKEKGDGGTIVAINVPDYATAQKIADDLDSKYESKQFPDDVVYGQWGKDHYTVDYHGAYIKPMAKADEMDEYTIKNGLHYGRIKDYSVKEAITPMSRSEARPGDPKSKTNAETGHKQHIGYKAYNPKDRGRHEKWSVDADVARRNEKVDKAKAKPSFTTLSNYLSARPPREGNKL